MSLYFVSRWSRYVAVSMVLLSVSGCDATGATDTCPLVGPGECYRYQAFDEQGTQQVTGFLKLNTDASDPDRITGTWQLTPVASAGGTHPRGLGTLVGMREGDAFSASLLVEGTISGADLSGLRSEGAIEGIWISNGPGAGASQGIFSGRVVVGTP